MGLIVVSLVVVIMVVCVVIFNGCWWVFAMEVCSGEVVSVWLVVVVVRVEGRDGADGLPAGGE